MGTSMSYVLAIDQGTTSTRALVFDVAGRCLGSASRELTQHYPQPGWVEHEPFEIWQSVAEVVPRRSPRPRCRPSSFSVWV